MAIAFTALVFNQTIGSDDVVFLSLGRKYPGTEYFGAATRQAKRDWQGYRQAIGDSNPLRGKATAHLVQFLAEEFQVPKSAITVVYGVYNVKKQVRITAPKQLPSVIPAQSDRG